ncbi:serine/threonine protein phosphatase [Bailinhaonella thermotolerans]|uniref:Serine/threonine protein phosphatase n=2 Tax=Bailinhaonella thermotolerans TaxID=1070861 RepID=A0A3A4B1K3_9ACTN|nr:serine/threonine protein phosphatase [Bailinhaonella thermotolerans]
MPVARSLVREALRAFNVTELGDSIMPLMEEIAAGTYGPLELACRDLGDFIQVEVSRVAPVQDAGPAVVPTGAASWGVTYEGPIQTVWARLAVPRLESDRSGGVAAQQPGDLREAAPPRQGWLGFLADASDLLAGTLDPDMVPAIIAQIVVPRLAAWCAVHMVDSSGDLRLSYLWHTDETALDRLREQLDLLDLPAELLERTAPTVMPDVDGSRTLSFPLVARGRTLGAMFLGRSGRFTDDVVELAEDLSGRAALSLDNARLYAQQAMTSRALQRSLLPPEVPEIPGLDYHVIYEPAGETNEVGGDFYDLFSVDRGRWRFAIGDVCGTGPEAAAVTGLARHTLRLLAKEGYGIAAVVSRLNGAILDEGPRARFLTLLHGEITRRQGGGVRLSLVSAGHPEALRLRPTGVVDPVPTPQSLLGVFADAEFSADTVDLDSGDVLLAVTDGVTERRSGGRLLDDDNGLSKLLSECVGLSAGAVAERIRRAVQEFAPEPSADDLAILVLRVP